MTDDAPDRYPVEFPDEVRVRRGHFTASVVTHQQGLRFGDWYVIECVSDDAVPDRDSNFDVGHNPTGLCLVHGATFQEARRIALAMDDADVDVELDENLNAGTPDPDLWQIVEGVVASALMDHYVFPLSNYLARRSDVRGGYEVDPAEIRSGFDGHGN